METVGDWLEGLGLRQYEDIFIEEQYDMEYLSTQYLEYTDLLSTGIDEDDIQRILDAASVLRSAKETSSSASEQKAIYNDNLAAAEKQIVYERSSGKIEKDPRQVLDTKPRAISVTGLPEVSEEGVSMFFEVERLSGGGPIETLVFMTDKGKVVITYKEPGVAEKVYGRYNTDGLQLEGTPIRVVLLYPITKRIDTSTKLECNKICLKKMDKEVTIDDVVSYFETYIMSCEVKCVIFGTKEGTAIVEFKKFPGYDELYQLACQRPLGRNMIMLEGVPKFYAVEVYGTGDMSEERLRIYFEHPMSQGGPVWNVECYKDFQCMVVSFEEHEVAKRVLQYENHTCEKKQISLRKHYNCIGIIPPGYDTSRVYRPPEEARVPLSDPRIIMYLLKHSTVRNTIEQRMMELHNALVEWKQASTERELVLRYQSPGAVNYTVTSEKWTEDVRQEMEKLLSQFDIVDMTIESEYWEEFYTLYQSSAKDKSGSYDEEVHADVYMVILMGDAGAVNDRKAEIEELEDTAVDNVKRKKDIVSEDITLQMASKLKLLTLINFFNQSKAKYTDMEIQVNEINKLVKITGKSADVQIVKRQMLTKCDEFSADKVDVSPLFAGFLSTAQAEAYVQCKMNSTKTPAAWEIISEEVYVSAVDVTSWTKAVQILKQSILEETVAVADSQPETSKMQQLQELRNNSHAGKVMVKVSVQGNSMSVTVIGCSDVHGEAMQTVKRFIADNTLHFCIITVSPAKFKYIEKYLHSDLREQVGRYSTKYKMQIKPNLSKSGYTAECNEAGEEKLRSIIKRLEDSIKYVDETVKQTGMSKYFSNEEGKSYLALLEADHKVIILKDEAIFSEDSTFTCTRHAKITFSTGKTLYLATGDITKVHTDVIVNAGSPDLQHGGGVAKAIVDAGGQVIQDQCTDHIHKNGKLKPGDVFVSTSGKLPCSHVIHTVGPKWSKELSSGNQDLCRAISHPLAEAASMGMQRVILPAISTGKYGFPLKLACETLVSEIWKFLNRGPHSVEEVCIVDNNRDVIRECLNITRLFSDGWCQVEDLEPIKEEKDKTSPVDSTGMNEYLEEASIPEARLCHLKKWEDCNGFGFHFICEKGLLIINQVEPDSPADLAGLQKGDRIVEINGEICHADDKMKIIEKMIVHPNHAKLLVVDERADKYFTEKQITITSTQNNIRHIVCPDKQPLPDGSSPDKWKHGDCEGQIVTGYGLRVTLVHGSIQDEKADSVVCLSSDTLDLQTGVVSKAILKKAGKKIQKECTGVCPKGGMIRGNVVATSGGSYWKGIYHSTVSFYDSPLAQQEMAMVMAESLNLAHKDQLNSMAVPSLGTGTLRFPPRVSASLIFEAIQNFSSRNKRTSLQSVSVVVFDRQHLEVFQSYMKELIQRKETQTEKLNWRKAVAADTIITNNDLQVELIEGNILDEKADVIVNLTDKDLNLSKGTLSKKILKKAGSPIQAELKKLKLTDCGDVLKTSGGDSDWKMIFHSSITPYNRQAVVCLNELARYITNCLNTADKETSATIAFPALLCGSGKAPAHKVARLMYGKIGEFSSSYPATSLKTVKIVVFEKKVFQIFQAHIADLLTGRVKSLQAPVTEACQTTLGQFQTTTRASKYWKEGSNGNEIITTNGITVEVCRGSVVTQKVDAIMTLTSKDLDLSKGHIPKEIMKKGGQKVQSELKKNHDKGIQFGQVVQSDAGKLNCKYIFFGACPEHSKDQNELHMEKIIMDCLRKANEAKLASLAFPSLGTGSLKYPVDSVSKLMFKCICNFSENYPGTSLKLVKLVIYEMDVRKAFEEVMHKQLKVATERQLVVDDFKELLSTRKAMMRSDRAQYARKKEVSFRIYGTSNATLQKVVELIHEKCCSEIQETVLASDLDKETISKFSNEQVARVRDLEKYDVSISIKQGTENKISIQGLKNDVLKVTNKIQEMFRHLDKQDRHVEEVRLLTKQAKWQFEEAGMWEDYEDEINAIIEKARLDNKTFAQWQEADESGKKFQVRINFNSMTETTIDGPKRDFRVREGTEDTESIALPSIWDKMPAGQVVSTVKLVQGTVEHSSVSKTFDDSMKRSNAAYKCIVQIERIQNPGLYRTYMATKATMSSRHTSSNPLQRTVWHATGKEVLNEINTNGFNRNFSGDKHGAWYGHGSYFASEAGTSATMYSGKGQQDRFMYQCGVLTGDYIDVPKQSGNKTAPPKDPKNPSIKYDSVVDNKDNPKEWVIFTDSQCYPEYLIKFQMQ